LESVQFIAIQHPGAMEDLARQSEGDALSVRAWIREGRGVLFLPYHAKEIAALRNVISAWIRRAIFEAMSAPERDFAWRSDCSTPRSLRSQDFAMVRSVCLLS